MSTQTSLTVANPDGTLTRTDHHQPVRVRRNNAWTPVDATLVRNPDGSWSPRATPSGVQLSGGGSGPLATFTDGKGRSLALTLPFVLPAPTVSGDSVRYAEVLPGVDLNATVTDQGAFREVLVVRDAKAAANPALRNLRLATTTKGLTAGADQDGNITAKADDGTLVFTAPTPVMWDSSTGPAAARNEGKARSAPAGGEPARPGQAADSRATVDTAGSGHSSDKGPGDHARISAIKVAADATSLTLTPDAAQLASPDTVWPVYIDPYVSPAPGGTNHYLEVQEGCAGPGPFDVAQPYGEGVGYQHFTSRCYGLERSFYEFDTSNLNGSMVVSKSTMYLTETHGADNGCDKTWPLTLQFTGAISNGMGWPGPAAAYNIATQNVLSAGDMGACGYRQVTFDVTDTVRSRLGASNLTFGLVGNESKYATNYGFMRFSTNPYIETVFDIAPNVPDQLGTTPASQNPASPACAGGNAGWIGESGSTNGKSNITLNARLTTPMNGVNLWAQFHVWDNMTNNGSGSPADASWPSSNWVASGSTVYANIGGLVADGHTYGWNVVAQDGTLGSPGSPYCYFSVDLTPPSVPTVGGSAVFPPLGSGTAPTGHAGDRATVKVTANDPTPAGCSLAACVSSGVHRFEYALDTNIPGNGATYKPAVPAGNGTATADIPIDVNTTQWGTHTLFVRAVDAAGNTRGTVGQYSFFAPWNPATKVIPGDLTTDGIPDLAATTADGNLVLIRGNSDPAAIPEQASTAGQSPEGNSWTDYLVTHRGSAWTTVDDLFAYSKSTHRLYLYKNDATSGGTPGHFSNTANVTQILTSGSCPAKGSDGTWNKVTQILAAGKLARVADAPDLITVDNKELWYYPGSKQAGCYLNSGVKIGTGDWSNVTLLAPGTVGGVPTLWARDNATGAVTSFPLTFSGGVPTTNVTAPVRAPLVSGILDSAGKNMCADVRYAGTEDGTAVEMYACNGSAAQTFTLGADNTVHALGKCLDVRQGQMVNGTLVQLWTCNNTPAQRWVAGPQPGTLMVAGTTKCLDDPGSSNTSKTQLTIWECRGTPNQVWAATTPGNTLPAAQQVLPVGAGDPRSDAASPGDVDGDGFADLYVASVDGEITRYPGAAPVNGLAQFKAPVVLGSVHQVSERWKLTDAKSTVSAVNNLTVTGGSLVADPARGTVLSLPGTAGSSAATASKVVRTDLSYAVSAWAYLTANGGYATVVGQAGTNVNSFYLTYASGPNAWMYTAPSNDSTSPTSYATVLDTEPAALNTWTHLVAVYDAGTSTMSLYVNGRLKGTAVNTSLWPATGPLVIGNATNSNPFPGRISDVQIWSSALSPSAVSALDGDRPVLTQLS
ncbi:LamG-like jellyroll fold domain-containing protein [Kitasatospora camelliae]|uniref:LamG-like jellyroll fold domain-containing protein n=1 Tax=Kitasatospora camelliae TaxID=3156397 RepID=A0AAU8JTF5_9ACTN